MEKRFSNFYILGLSILMSSLVTGCAMSEMSEGDDLDAASDELPVLAETDQVPAENAENPGLDDLDAPADDLGAQDPMMAAADPLEQPADQQPLDQPPEALPSDMPPAMEDPAMLAAAEPAPPVDPVTTEPAPAIEAETPTIPTESYASSSSEGSSQDYTVQSGDTLMKIAFENYGDLYQWKKIYEDNREKITNPNAIPRGTVLTLKDVTTVEIAKNGDKYLIRSGDTLGTISDDIYGTTKKWRKLWQNNKQLIRDPNRIFAGFYLYYTMTPDERREAEELKQMRDQTVEPAPMAQGPDSGLREPSGVPSAPSAAAPIAPSAEMPPAGALAPPPPAVSAVPVAPNGG